MFFVYFLVDVFFDVGVIDVDDDYFGCMLGGFVGFDGVCCVIVDFEERYQVGVVFII